MREVLIRRLKQLTLSTSRHSSQRLAALFFVLVMIFSSAGPVAPLVARAYAVKQNGKSVSEKVKPLNVSPAKDSEVSPGPGVAPYNVPTMDKQPDGGSDIPRIHAYEDVSKRTATSKTYVNTDGTRTLDYSVVPKHYQKNGKWEELKPHLQKNGAYKSGKSIADTSFNPFADDTQEVNAITGDFTTSMRPFEDGLEVTVAGKTFTVTPVGARNVRPTVSYVNDHEIITYKNAWPDVDVDYEIIGASLKETIVIKKSSAQNSFVFALDGITAKDDPVHEGGLALEGIDPNVFFVAPLTVTVGERGMISEQVAKMFTKGKTIAITVDADWLKKQPKQAFPIAVDPSFYHDVGGTYGLFKAYKSDGYMCTSQTCDPQAGGLNDNGYKRWRTMFRIPFDELQGGSKKVLAASIHLVKKQRTYWTGYDGWFSVDTSWAPCFGFECRHDASYEDGAGANTNDWSNVRRTVAWMAGEDNPNPQWGGWFIMWGDEGAYSYKQFEPTSLGMSVVFDNLPTMALPAAPANQQVVVTTQPSLSVAPAGDADGEAVQYYFRVSASPDAESGAIINSGWQPSNQWTVPEGVLQDGTTYYWHTYTWDGVGGAPNTVPNWTSSFKVDLRTGKDNTQAYDSAGPVSVDLATGNASISDSSHTIGALGGSIGLSLDYNTPIRSTQGLKGQYWNNIGQSGTPVITRTEQTVDFRWQAGSPSPSVPADSFSAKWSGYFVAPKSGDYFFGGVNDDHLDVRINGQVQYSNDNCPSAPCYGTSVNLTEGQVVPIEINYVEFGGAATAVPYVKGPVAEQTIPKDWLRTPPTQTSLPNGLVGRYYTDDGSHVFPNDESDPFRHMMTRTDTAVNFNWGSGSPVPNGRTDNFMVRWRGYITVPTSGDYTFGAYTDDGLRVKIGANSDGSDVLALNYWQPAGLTYWSPTTVNLTANRPYPITVEYFEAGGGAAVDLYARGPGISDREVPSTWLMPKAPVLPAGWNLSVDADGNLAYERLQVNQNSVVLTDSKGFTHEYTFANGAYKPPVNEDGNLVRNGDGTFTMTDVDGKVYLFDTLGQLTSVSIPQDDRKPAALQYVYGGNPSRLLSIKDGADPNRNGQLYYGGDNECVTPANFEPAPAGILCAFKTSDGAKTNFYYKQSRLARIEKPGSEVTDYGYDSPNCSGCVSSVRDSLAADAIAALVRPDDDSTKTQLAYDGLGRVLGVTIPAPTAGAAREQKTYEYGAPNNAAWSEPAVISNELPSGSPNLVNWGAGKLAAFARFGTNELKYKLFQNGTWGGWQSLGNCMLDDPSAASWEPGRIDVFIRGCDNQLFTRTYIGDKWYDFAPLGSTGITSSPSATTWGLWRYDVSARGPNNELMNRSWTPSTGWTGFYSIGGCISQAPTVSTWGYERLNFYVVGCGSPTNLFAKYWDRQWIEYTVLTGEQNISSAPQSVSTHDKKIHIVARGANGDLRYLYYNGTTWENWATLQPCITGSPAITKDGDAIVVAYKGCDGNMYQLRRGQNGTTKVHATGTEPNGYTDKVDYDSLYRTVKDYDKTGQATKTEWDPVKDLTLSTTDATGLKTTSIYDDEDRPTDSYGPAPAAWFGSDRKPLAAYVNQVPHTQTNYDEGIVGPAVAYYNYKATGKSLFGAPKLHATGIEPTSPGVFMKVWGNTPPLTPDDGMDGWGMAATGKIRAPATGTYTFHMWHDDGLRLYIDDQLVINDWNDGAYRRSDYSRTMEANKVYRLKVDYYSATAMNNGATLDLFLSAVNAQPVAADRDWSQELTPSYNLTTSTKVFDSQTGDVTNTTNYGAKPELGQVVSAVEDSGGQNLTSSFTYEPYQSGSLMRQTSKTLPGGNTFTYNYYSATEARDNPCVAGSPAVSQAGMVKGKAEPDPDGAGSQTSRTTETVYDAAGRIVATRYNNDAWTCSTYDARGRVASTSIPARGQYQPARTITNNYAVGGNPLVVSTTDSNGTIYTTTDLLGRTVSYTDAQGSTTTSAYDDQGHLTGRDGPLGHEEFIYDQFDRLVDQKLDGTLYAHIAYDQFSRIENVTYPDAGQQKVSYARDTLGRLNGLSYDGLSGGTTTTTTGPGPNLIANPSLETPVASDPNAPNQWFDGSWGTNTYTLTYPNAGHTGNRSVKTEITDFTDGDAKWYFEPVTVTPDTEYTFKDYYQSNVTTNVIVQFTHQDGSHTYQWVGAPAASADWTQNQYSFTTPATATRVSVFHIVDRVGWLTLDDAELYVTSQTTTTTTGGGTLGVIASDTVSRSVTGDILSGTENGLAKNYTYDKTGRLTNATIGSNTYSYDYSAPTAAQCGQASANLSAHKNSNRTSMTINGATTTYCYDYADRLISSSDPKVSNPVYDDHGNMTQIGATNNTLRLMVDASDRSRGVEQYDDNGNGKAVYYARDAQNRITYRETNNISDWNWALLEDRYFGFTGSGDTPDFVRNANWDVVEKYLQLPGNVLLTIRPGENDAQKQKTYSLPNIHGDIFATTNAGGVLTSTHITGPFGESVTGQTNPNNSVLGTTYGYVGQHEKLTETDFSIDFVQMGARVYIPILGRFAQVDPVEGGTDNSYAYVSDPVNDFDLDGTFSFKKAWKWVGKHADTIGMAAAAVGFAACAVATAGVCVGVAIGAAAVTGAASGLGTYGRTGNLGKSIGSGLFSAGTGLIGLKKIQLAGKVLNKGLPKAVRWFGKSRNYKSARTALRTKAGQQRLTSHLKRFRNQVAFRSVLWTWHNSEHAR